MDRSSAFGPGRALDRGGAACDFFDPQRASRSASTRSVFLSARLNPGRFCRAPTGWSGSWPPRARIRSTTSLAAAVLDAKDPTRLDGVGDVYSTRAGSRLRREGRRVLDGPAYDTPKEALSPCAAAALYRRRDVVEQPALFDEDFFCYTEEVDLGFRLRLLGGGRFLYVPDAIVDRIGSGVSGVRQRFPALPRPRQPRPVIA